VRRSIILRKEIDLIVYDFDGVMTDNTVLLQEDGREAVRVSRADGLGINLIRKKKIPQLILSTEKNPVVRARARKVRVPLIQGVDDKRAALQAYCERYGYSLRRTIYVGNDTNDIDAIRSVGIAVAPADAHPSILRLANLVLKTPGGAGVVRELADRLR
jgi:YrbI family 3-deoxy-D-manno-octulosonate 8-phosphate phosphatase